MRRILTLLLSVALAFLGAGAFFVAPAQADDAPAGWLVKSAPAAGTPHALDGAVKAIAQVGNTMLLGGTFTSPRNDNSQTAMTRNRLLAFDISSGLISTAFNPNANGAVEAVIPAGDGSSVYVGGNFSSINGVARSKVARVRVSDGAVLPFDAGAVNGSVRDLRLSDGRLWIAGAFTHVRGNAQRALATVNANTGAFDPYMRLAIDGVHNGGTTVGVKMDITPDGSRLVLIGNFDTLEGVKHHQLLMIDSSGATAQPADFQTAFYETACSRSFDSNMRDLDISPDGKFFVVSTTGAYGGSTTACDSTARFEIDSTGSGIKPSWIDHTGGDTTYAVEITSDGVVYVGGHQRWQNNPFAGDRAGQGAVSRPGIAALDVRNGLPFSRNPTRTRGVGVFDLYYNAQGLWVASDTDRIGAYVYKGRIALMPRAGGSEIEAQSTPTLPNDVYVAGATGQATDPSVLYRVNAGGPQLSAATGMDWGADTDASPSPYQNNSSTRASYSAVPGVDATVPSSTPQEIFSTELWDPGASPEQAWDFPVPDGVPLRVNLFFADRCSCTATVGLRRFNVDLEGTRVLNNFDVTDEAGHDRGTMRSFDITSDGNVDIDLGHVTENSMISGIEIRRTDLGPAPDSQIVKHTYGDSDIGPALAVPAGGLNWNLMRGGFMVNGRLYQAWSDGTFTRRTFNGTAYGASTPVNTQDQIVALTDWQNDIKQATGLFYDSGRIYFTLSGSNQLYYRYFTPENDVVGAARYVASQNVDGINFSQVRGMFGTGNRLFWATPDGALHRINWTQGAQSGSPVASTATQVSGPGVDTNTWAGRAMFLFQNADGNGVPMPPNADFTYQCQGRTCTFDGTSSTAPGSNVTQYVWDFGDGSTGSGATVQHSFATNGTSTVTLNITTGQGATDSTTREVTVNQANTAPVASFTASCAGLVCSVDGSGSSDADGDSLTYSWAFGDGGTATGVTASHEYAAAGPRTITLTVSDGAESGVTTRAVNPVVVTDEIALVGSASSEGNRSVHSVRIPNAVRAGDTLVLFLMTNSTSSTVDDALAGWSLLESEDGNGTRGRAWTRQATAADAGELVSVSTSGLAKSTLSFAAYRNAGGSSSVSKSSAAVQNSASTSHPAPAVAVTDAGSLLVSFWAEKSSGAVTWSLPGGVTLREGAAASGSGKVSSVLGDSDGPVAVGTAPARSATTSDSVGRTIDFSVVIAPN